MLTRALIPVLLLVSVTVCSAAPKKGEQAPPYSGLTPAGKTLSQADYRGQVVILDFFATWCAACRQLNPVLSDIARRYPVKVIGLEVSDAGAAKIEAYGREKGVGYPLAAATGRTETDYGVRALPTLYVIGRNGTVAGSFTGYNREIGAQLEALVKKSL